MVDLAQPGAKLAFELLERGGVGRVAGILLARNRFEPRGGGVGDAAERASKQRLTGGLDPGKPSARRASLSRC